MKRKLAVFLLMVVLSVAASAQSSTNRASVRHRPPTASASSMRPLYVQSVGISASGPQTVIPPGFYALSLDGDLDMGGFLFKEGYPFLHNYGGAVAKNTAIGVDALISLTPGVPNLSSGYQNTAVGTRALQSTTSGSANTAVGDAALANNIDGSANVTAGQRALTLNASGDANTGVGFGALLLNTGSYNTGIGALALKDNSSAGYNTAVGYLALSINHSGESNTASATTSSSPCSSTSSRGSIGRSELCSGWWESCS